MKTVTFEPVGLHEVAISLEDVVREGLKAASDAQLTSECEERGIAAECVRDHVGDAPESDDAPTFHIEHEDLRELTGAIARGERDEAMRCLERLFADDDALSHLIQVERFSAKNRRAA